MKQKAKDFFAEIQDVLKQHDDTAEGFAEGFQLDLATMIVKALDKKRWSQKDLAEAAGVSPIVINRLVHGTSNFESRTAGKVLHALGVRAKFVPSSEVPSNRSARKLRMREKTGRETRVLQRPGRE